MMIVDRPPVLSSSDATSRSRDPDSSSRYRASGRSSSPITMTLPRLGDRLPAPVGSSCSACPAACRRLVGGASMRRARRCSTTSARRSASAGVVVSTASVPVSSSRAVDVAGRAVGAVAEAQQPVDRRVVEVDRCPRPARRTQPAALRARRRARLRDRACGLAGSVAVSAQPCADASGSHAGLGEPDQTYLAAQLEARSRRRPVADLRRSRPCTSAAVAPSPAWMKLACLSETNAPPIRNPRRPSAIDQLTGRELARESG